MLFQHNKFSFTPNSNYCIQAVGVSLDSKIKNNPSHYNCTNQREVHFSFYTTIEGVCPRLAGDFPYRYSGTGANYESVLSSHSFQVYSSHATLLRKAKYNTPGHRISLKQERQIFPSSSFNHICYSLIYIFSRLNSYYLIFLFCSIFVYFMSLHFLWMILREICPDFLFVLRYFV